MYSFHRLPDSRPHWRVGITFSFSGHHGICGVGWVANRRGRCINTCIAGAVVHMAGGDDKKDFGAVAFDINEQRSAGIGETEVERKCHRFGECDGCLPRFGQSLRGRKRCEKREVKDAAYVELPKVESDSGWRRLYVVGVELIHADRQFRG
jgi:hypothetical protein